MFGYNGFMNLLVSFLTLGAWAAWGYIVLFVNPEVPLAPAGFYAALFLALTGTLSRMLGGADPVQGEDAAAAPNIGHAAVVSVLILFALWLQSLGMLTPLNGTLLAITFLLIELGFFLSGAGRRKARQRRRSRRAAIPESGSASDR
ncbi:MAG: hypothetical protein ACYC66_12160 [Chloroflexota bacterium]